MDMEDMTSFLQNQLERDFHYEDDLVVEELQKCQEELRKSNMDIPPKSKNNERPTLPFGLDIQPSVEQLIGKRGNESMDEHFRQNPKRGGKAAYLRKKNAGGAGNHLGTPEMGRGGGSRGDTRSIQSSRYSEYSLDASSYYDTAANSRLSLADRSRGSIPSSRTSVADTSDLGSMTLTYGGVPGFPEDVMNGELDVTTPTTPTPGLMTPTPFLTASSTFQNDENGVDMMEHSAPRRGSQGSYGSDYDNVNSMYTDEDTIAERAPTSVVISLATPASSHPPTYISTIPISKSDGYVSRSTAAEGEFSVTNGHLESCMKATRTENASKQDRFYDETRSSEIEQQQNGVVVERQRRHQVASTVTTQSTTVYTRRVERMSQL
jgi:hypothetical protein